MDMNSVQIEESVENTFENSMTVDHLSLFEQLPADLAWKIIDLVPDSSRDIRLVGFFVIVGSRLGTLKKGTKNMTAFTGRQHTFQTSQLLHKRVTEYAFLRPEIRVHEFTIYGPDQYVCLMKLQISNKICPRVINISRLA